LWVSTTERFHLWVEGSQYWVELARHPGGFTLFYSPHKQRLTKRPNWVSLKLMLPAVPGRRIERRVWLSWDRDKRQLARSEFADTLPEIYGWVWDTAAACLI
jgi:hypothetical protein